MIVKLLGIADLLSVLIVMLLHFSVGIGWQIPLIFVAYLVVKGFMFRADWNSYLDIGSAIYILLMLFGVHTFIAYIVAAYLLQKSVFSLV